ncbi:MAG: hypothetical protein M3270_07410 [Thermoproteota archaeon]|nr:hypothetical protein [Thermoproteota archaeon]
MSDNDKMGREESLALQAAKQLSAQSPKGHIDQEGLYHQLVSSGQFDRYRRQMLFSR